MTSVNWSIALSLNFPWGYLTRSDMEVMMNNWTDVWHIAPKKHRGAIGLFQVHVVPMEDKILKMHHSNLNTDKGITMMIWLMQPSIGRSG